MKTARKKRKREGKEEEEKGEGKGGLYGDELPVLNLKAVRIAFPHRLARF